MSKKTTTAYRMIGTGSIVLVTLLSIGCSDDPPDGKELYNDFCARCHGINNAGTENAPPVQIATFQAIRNAIDFESAMFNATDLGTLSRGEITAIADYIRTISPP